MKVSPAMLSALQEIAAGKPATVTSTRRLLRLGLIEHDPKLAELGDRVAIAVEVTRRQLFKESIYVPSADGRAVLEAAERRRAKRDERNEARSHADHERVERPPHDLEDRRGDG